MTVSSTISRSGPYAGAGTTGPFAVGFRFLEDAHLRVVKTNSQGVDADLILGIDFFASGAGEANGSVILVAPLATNERLTILRAVPATQEADYVQNDAFPAESHERALDKLTMIAQQQAEQLSRTLRLGVSVNTNPEFPSPSPNKFIGWDSAGARLVNADIAALSEQFVYADWRYEKFVGDGTTVQFFMDASPANIANMDVSMDGLSLVPVDDYSLFGNVLVFATAPSPGVKILVRYGQVAGQREIFQSITKHIATAGQTVFTLVDGYIANQNALAVYVNGLRLEGGGIDYNETDETTVTFSTGLADGDSVIFVVGTEVIGGGSAGPSTANSVTYSHPAAPAVVRTLQAKAEESVNVADFGAVGDGITDDTAAFQAAINWLQSTSSPQMTLNLDAKPYRIVGSLEVTGPVRLVGQGYLDFENARPTTRPPKGTWLIHANPTGHLIRFTGDMGKCGGMTNIGIFQEGHPAPGPGWAPAVRDWVIRNENTHGTLILDRIHFHGVYQGVLTDFSVRPQYENLTGQFFFRGFTFDRIYDLGKFEGLHAWTFWSEADSVLQWQQANCVEITLLRVDGLWMDRIFTFAVAVSIYVGTSTYGGTARVIYVHGLYSDFCGRAVVVDSSVAHMQIANLFHLGQAWPPTSPANALPGSAGLDVTSGNNHNIQIGSYYSVLCETASVRVVGSFNQVWIASPILEQYDRAGVGSGPFNVTATNIVNLGSLPSMNKYGGGGGQEFVGTPGGTVVRPMKEVVNTAVVNRPVGAGNTTGQLSVFTAEGEADAGVAVLAKTTGVVQLGSASNKVGFYGSLGGVKQTVTGSRGGNAALTSLLDTLTLLGLITNSTTL